MFLFSIRFRRCFFLLLLFLLSPGVEFSFTLFVRWFAVRTKCVRWARSDDIQPFVLCNNNFYLNLLHTKNSKCIIKQHKKRTKRSEQMCFFRKKEAKQQRKKNRTLRWWLLLVSSFHEKGVDTCVCVFPPASCVSSCRWPCERMRWAVSSVVEKRARVANRANESELNANGVIRIQNYVYERRSFMRSILHARRCGDVIGFPLPVSAGVCAWLNPISIEH